MNTKFRFRSLIAGLVIGIMSLAPLQEANAVSTVVSNIPAAAVRLMLDGPVTIQSITINNTNAASNVLVQMYNAPTAAIAYSRAAITNYTYTQSFVTNQYTDILGRAVSNVYPASLRTTNSWPSTNRLWDLTFVTTVVSNTVVTFDTPFYVPLGCTFSNLGASVITINYTQE